MYLTKKLADNQEYTMTKWDLLQKSNVGITYRNQSM